MKKNIIFLFCGTVALLLSGCNDFLDKQPSKSTSLVVETVDHLDALLEGALTDKNNRTTSNDASVYGTDDCGIHIGLYDARPAAFTVSTAAYFCWDTDIIANEQTSLWSSEYSKIFLTNLILDNLSYVSGSEEHKNQLRMEAHFLRAWSMMELVNTYCLPYTEATKDELGLALKQSTSFEETSTRGTLEQTHALIQADLEEALKLTTALVVDGKVRHWRANKGAANALAARYWLGQGDYGKALGYADAALGVYSDLVDYNTEMKYAQPDSHNPTVNLYFNQGNPSEYEEYKVWYPNLNPGQSNTRDIFDWKEFYIYRTLTTGNWWFVPSQNWLNLFGASDKEVEAAAQPDWTAQRAVLEEAEAVRSVDLRYKYHVVEGSTFDTPANMNRPPYFWYSYCFFYKGEIPYGPTVPEMILTRAECLARLDRIPDAMSAVNILRAKRIDATAGAGVINLSASTKQEAIAKILEERRREMPFTVRWFDLRRFQINDDPSDDVDISRVFYPISATAVNNNASPMTYTLKKGDRKWAMPIPNSDIISSEGKLQQNSY